MNYSTAIFLISEQARAVMTVYEDGDHATRKMHKTLDKDIKVDDYVIVPTETRHNMTVVKVVEVDVDVDFDASVQINWIIGVVDMTAHSDIKRQEDDAIAKIMSAEKRRKRDELREAMIADHGASLKTLPIYTAEQAPKIADTQ